MKDKKTGRFVIKHGMDGTRIYNCWHDMKTRCLNSNCKAYKDYGDRGIKVCKEWLEFENFFRDMGDMPQNKTLDRINNEGNYCKSNCKWSTKKEQQNNTRRNHFLTHKNKTQTIKQWADELGIKYVTLQTRIRKGWKLERALANK